MPVSVSVMLNRPSNTKLISKKLYPVLKSRAADVAKAESARARTSQGKASSASKRKLIVERGSRS